MINVDRIDMTEGNTLDVNDICGRHENMSNGIARDNSVYFFVSRLIRLFVDENRIATKRHSLSFVCLLLVN
jgi:hypothetical protein